MFRSALTEMTLTDSAHARANETNRSKEESNQLWMQNCLLFPDASANQRVLSGT